MLDWRDWRLRARTGGWNRISHIGLRAQTCWVAPDRRPLHDMHINWRSAWRATQPSENTFAVAAMIFRSRADGNRPMRRSSPCFASVPKNDGGRGNLRERFASPGLAWESE